VMSPSCQRSLASAALSTNPASRGLVLRVVNEFLDELADGVAGLLAKVFW